MSILSRPYFHDEPTAFQFLESLLWADDPACSKCGSVGEAGKLERDQDEAAFNKRLEKIAKPPKVAGK